MQQRIIRTAFVGACAIALVHVCGCVRRTARFTTVPEGARVHVNDLDLGQSPVSMDFTWYGDYDVICRMEGYQTLKTHVQINAPWYQLFPIDFFAEVCWPGEIHDHHEIALPEMSPRQTPTPEELANRAMQLRSEVTGEQQIPIQEPLDAGEPSSAEDTPEKSPES